MVVETGALSYWRGNRAGDVKAEQNNFAGLGATGGGERGESFRDIESGVRAHLEHLLLYAGYPVENPVAERTRKGRDWCVLTSWQHAFKRPITYTDLAAKWAPGSRGYAGMLRAVADQFDADICNRPDPRPGLVQEARAKAPGTAKTAEAQPPPLSPGAELAQRAIEEAKAEGTAKRSSLGAQPPSDQPPQFAPFKILNPPPVAAPAPEPSSSAAVAKPAPAEAKPAITTGTTAKADAKAAAPKAAAPDKAGARTAMASASVLGPKTKAPVDTAVPPAANQKCRVWTASYGGQKAVIIRSVVDQVVNFTVLDVNENAETREVEAFISAYAKNGRVAGEYGSQAQALDKAFELCPEG
jgi:hypothetical protein